MELTLTVLLVSAFSSFALIQARQRGSIPRVVLVPVPVRRS